MKTGCVSGSELSLNRMVLVISKIVKLYPNECLDDVGFRAAKEYYHEENFRSDFVGVIVRVFQIATRGGSVTLSGNDARPGSSRFASECIANSRHGDPVPGPDSSCSTSDEPEHHTATCSHCAALSDRGPLFASGCRIVGRF